MSFFDMPDTLGKKIPWADIDVVTVRLEGMQKRVSSCGNTALSKIIEILESVTVKEEGEYIPDKLLLYAVMHTDPFPARPAAIKWDGSVSVLSKASMYDTGGPRLAGANAKNTWLAVPGAYKMQGGPEGITLG